MTGLIWRFALQRHAGFAGDVTLSTLLQLDRAFQQCQSLCAHGTKVGVAWVWVQKEGNVTCSYEQQKSKFLSKHQAFTALNSSSAIQTLQQRKCLTVETCML